MSTTTMIVLSVLAIVALVAVLAIYLYVVGSQLSRVAGTLEECSDVVREIVTNAEPIQGGVDHINRTGGVVAGALPLLYGMAEGIVRGVTYPAAPASPQPGSSRPPNLPASGTRRSRMHDSVGYRPDESQEPVGS